MSNAEDNLKYTLDIDTGLIVCNCRPKEKEQGTEDKFENLMVNKLPK